MDPAIGDVLEKTAGTPLTRGALGDLQQAAVQQVLSRLVEVELARWLHNSMMVLKLEFDFDQDQMTQYAQAFRKAMANEQTTQPTE